MWSLPGIPLIFSLRGFITILVFDSKMRWGRRRKAWEIFPVRWLCARWRVRKRGFVFFIVIITFDLLRKWGKTIRRLSFTCVVCISKKFTPKEVYLRDFPLLRGFFSGKHWFFNCSSAVWLSLKLLILVKFMPQIINLRDFSFNMIRFMSNFQVQCVYWGSSLTNVFQIVFFSIWKLRRVVSVNGVSTTVDRNNLEAGICCYLFIAIALENSLKSRTNVSSQMSSFSSPYYKLNHWLMIIEEAKESRILFFRSILRTPTCSNVPIICNLQKLPPSTEPSCWLLTSQIERHRANAKFKMKGIDSPQIRPALK